jgi:hypothetical protein
MSAASALHVCCTYGVGIPKVAAAHGLRGVWSASDLRHEPSATSRHHLWRGVPPHRPGRRRSPEASGTALSDVRQAIPLEAARQPLLLVALPAEGLSPTAGGGHSPRTAALSRANSHLAFRAVSA